MRNLGVIFDECCGAANRIKTDDAELVKINWKL